ncbi:hypothetical protein AB0M47_39210 [Hamadaea sp. NPDC051192]|uniref:hypothetical protein n=1 Tax=Hamadaea sp. NPDC051192 TaxID=3154940 RepID=UPI0034218661
MVPLPLPLPLRLRLRLRGAAARSFAFVRDGDNWTCTSSILSTFMPLRASMDDARRQVPLPADGDVVLQVNKDQVVDTDELSDVLASPRAEVWTDVRFGPGQTFEWMELWLAMSLSGSILRMNTQPSAHQSGVVAPMFGWGAYATVTGPDLAYLTKRVVDGIWEVGVIGHGPDGNSLAHLVAEQVRVWDENFRAREVDFALCAAAGPADPAAGRFVLPRSDHSIVVTWQ